MLSQFVCLGRPIPAGIESLLAIKLPSLPFGCHMIYCQVAPSGRLAYVKLRNSQAMDKAVQSCTQSFV